LMLIPLMGLAIVLAQGYISGTAGLGRSAVIAAMFIAAFLIYMGQKMWRESVKRDALKAGYDAELAVGQELDQLIRQGAYVFHDFPADHFNIDHVVIAPHGVFAVETKGYTKPIDKRGKVNARMSFDGEVLRFPTFTTREPIEQAKRQADWLTKWLSSATGSAMHALPILALPGWYVEQSGVGAVRVFSGPQLNTLLQSLGAKRLSNEDLQRAVHQVQQRCQTVIPKHAEAEKAT
ncbi:MAG: NERD domain-containing protein, partial [Alcaligenaceae bacterium]